jgi:hypothetical protein
MTVLPLYLTAEIQYSEETGRAQNCCDLQQRPETLEPSNNTLQTLAQLPLYPAQTFHSVETVL